MWTAAWQRQTSESWTLRLSSSVAACCGQRCRKWRGALPGLGVTALAAAGRASNHEDCGRPAGGWVVMPVSDSCPNGAECDNPGRRPGIHATHRPNPQTGASPYPPSVSPIHTHHPCHECIPTILSPGLHPGLVCVDPLGRMERCRAPITYRPPELRNRPANPHECLRCEVSRSAWAVAKRTLGRN